MNANANPDERPIEEQDIASRNIERLLRTAYDPESPEAAFAERVRGKMLQAAEGRRRQPPRPGARAGDSAIRFPIRRAAGWAALAAGVLIALGVFVSTRLDNGPSGPTPPGVVAGPAAKPGVPRTFVGDNGLTACQRPAAPTTRPAEIGSWIETGPGQRRLATLADGSTVYVNQNTRLLVEAQRRLRLERGEVYVEVAPRPAGGQDGRFVVATPRRQVTALGTKFAVREGTGGTSVFVTQGKVQVSGYGELLYAGRQLDAGGGGENALTEIPRASAKLEWTRELMAAAESPLVPASEYAGGALVAVDPNGQEARLSLRRYHVDVHIQDGFARTTIDQTYFNHMNWRLEGTFYFPLPPDASISRLAMYVNGQLMEGGMADREQARYAYEDIMYTRRDPALLEWVDGSTFKMRVFPLEGRQEKRIILSYCQKLDTFEGKTAYRFAGGLNMPVIDQWSFHARVVAGAQAEWSCDGHELKAATQDGDLLLDAAETNVQPTGLVLNLANLDPAYDNAESARFSWCEHENFRYLMLRYRPALQAVAGADARRRDWVFLFESSGDRDPLLARAQIDVIQTLLKHADPGDRFAVLTAGTHVNVLADALQPVTPDNVASAIQFLEQAHLVGALDLEGALAGAGKFLREGHNPHLVHVGTGIAVLGQRGTSLLVKQIPAGAHYVGVGVGKRWARDFMKSAAAATGGYFTQINPDENIAWRAFEVLSTLNTPRLLDVKVACQPPGADWLTFVDSIAGGEEICAVTRLDGKQPPPASVTVTGTLDGQPFSRTLPVPPTPGGADYLPRFWAKLEIDRLLAADANANKDKIVQLSKDMYVMSPFTSLLVLENDQMYQQYKIDRGWKDHWAMYPAPGKIPVTVEPAPDRPNAAPSTQPGTKPSAEQVLQTILVRVPPAFLTWPNAPYYYNGQTVTAWQLCTMPDPRLDGDDIDFLRGDISSGGGSGGSPLRLPWRNGQQLSSSTRGPGQAPFGDRLPSGVPLLGSVAGPMDVGRRIDFNTPLETARPVVTNSKGMLRKPAPSVVGSRLAGPPDKFSDWGRIVTRLNAPADDVPRSSELKGLDGWSRYRHDAGDGGWDLRWSRWHGAGVDYGLTVPYFGYSDLYIGPTAYGYRPRNVLYQRPTFTGDWRLFNDLLVYAPGMNTSGADIQAAVEAEAQGAAAALGKTDPAARELIDKARSAGWRSAAMPAEDGNDEYLLTFDGQGRYAYLRTLSTGLEERVVCDGTSLWRLYDELGVGAQRKDSRFHRRELCGLLPWLLPPAEDLAAGCDVTHAGDGTVVVRPIGAVAAKDEQGKPLPHGELRLVFDAGRLVERQFVQMPSGKVAHRQTYAADGTVKWFDGDGKETFTRQFNIRPAVGPQLAPDMSKLVVLPMPLRNREHVLATRKIADNAGRYAALQADDACALLAAGLAAQDGGTVFQIVGQRFFQRDDRRIGFYVLMLASGLTLDLDTTQRMSNNEVIRFYVSRDHADKPLARYILEQSAANRSGKREFARSGDREGFVGQLIDFRYLYYRWSSGRATSVGTEEDRRRERQWALGFVRNSKASPFAWAALGMLLNYGGDAEFRKAIADAWPKFQDIDALSYAARYESARGLLSAGEVAAAVNAFEKLYRDALQAGGVPAIDHEFRNAFLREPQYQEKWAGLMRQAVSGFTAQDRPAAAVLVAWQCHQVGDGLLAEELMSAALAGASERQRVPATLTAVEFLWQTGQLARADAAIEPLLKEEALADDPLLWRLAAGIAGQRGRLASALQRLEKAMDLEYARMPAVVNLQAVRNDYQSLLRQYEQLAQAVATLQAEQPKELLSKTIRAADRWRSLDVDSSAPCQAAAGVFQALGQRELAWEYLTTPLAVHPNEAAPWTSLAQTLKQQGEFDLAERAYVSAFAAEGTNAQVLWERAQLLQQLGKGEQARQLYRQIAEGQWPRQFNGIQAEAKRIVGTR